MSEIFSAIRLKDRIIIATVMSVFAFLLAGSAGAITYASINNHAHEYDNYRLEMTDNGDFMFVGTCVREGCKNPKFIYADDFKVYEEIITEPTCSTEGEKAYYARFDTDGDGKYEKFVYSKTETIPTTPHVYSGEVDLEGGNVTLRCTNEGCTEPDFVITAADELKLESTVGATCSKPREDKYSYTANGVTGSFTTYTEVEDAPHVLNGVPVTEYEIGENTYLYGTKGMSPADNIATKPTGCGQWVIGFYQCETCDAPPVAIRLGLPDHEYVLQENTLTMADFDQAGQITVKCSRLSCGDTKKINLPKADREINVTLVSVDEENLKQTWKYTFYSEKYDATVEYEFVTDWIHDHVFVHDPAMTQMPSLDLAGKAIVKCSVDGCTEMRQIVLPKIQIGNNTEAGDNSVLIVPEATELKAKTVRYTYVSEKYGFTEVLEIKISNTLSHAYIYYLEPYGNGFAVIGRCDQPECQKKEFVKEENVTPNYVNTSDCTNFGEEIWSHPTDSSVKPFKIPSFDLMGHKYQCGTEDIITLPGFTEGGKANAKCENCDETVEIDLPKLELGEEGNADIIEIDNENGTQTVKYSYVQNVDGNDIVVELEYVINEAHVHDYVTELEPKDGQFDLVSRCTSTACGEEIREENVPAVLIKDTVSCTDPGYQTWSYVKNNVVYNCNIINFEAEGHYIHYNPDAATTVNPTFEKGGSIVVFCNKCDTQTRTVELPPMDDNNSTWLEDTKYDVAYLYTYVTEDNITIMLILKLPKK